MYPLLCILHTAEWTLKNINQVNLIQMFQLLITQQPSKPFPQVRSYMVWTLLPPHLNSSLSSPLSIIQPYQSPLCFLNVLDLFLFPGLWWSFLLITEVSTQTPPLLSPEILRATPVASSLLITLSLYIHWQCPHHASWDYLLVSLWLPVPFFHNLISRPLLEWSF